MSGGKLAIDIGARFADFASWDEAGLRVAKRPVAGSLAEVVLAGIHALSLDLSTLEELRLVTTAPLNALLARQAAPVALVTTRGFGDTLRLGRQNRAALYDPVARSPAPAFLVDPALVFETGGRMDAAGQEVEPFDEAGLAEVIAALRAARVEAVAVCYLFAHLAPQHELRAAAMLRAALPDLRVSLSHQVDPGPREYERTVSVMLDAWLAATSAHEVTGLRRALAERGFAGALLLGEGRGVLVPDDSFDLHRSVLLTGAPAAAARAGSALQDAPLVLAMDIGSRSADISMLRDGAPVAVEQGRIAGVPLRVPTLDMASLSLGGAQTLSCGPRGLVFGAGVEAGETPVLDDALSVLGWLDAPREGAEARLAALRPGAEAEQTARAAVQAAADLAALELTRYATRRNVDPTRAQLMLMGGCGALLAAEIAQAMGLDRVALPAAPGVAGALGLALAPQRAEARRQMDQPLTGWDDAGLDDLLDTLAREGGGAEVLTFTLAPLRQMHPMPLVLGARPASVAALVETFAGAYRAAYGIAPPGPGHLFAVAVHHDRADALPAPATPAGAAVEGPALHDTAAGRIRVPEGWRLIPGAATCLLERISR